MRKGVRGGVTHKVAIAIDVVAGNAGCRVPVEGHVAAVEGVGQVGGNGVVRRRINVYNDRLVVVVKFIMGYVFVRWVGTKKEYDKLDCSIL